MNIKATIKLCCKNGGKEIRFIDLLAAIFFIESEYS
jgi:hypothetical protein